MVSAEALLLCDAGRTAFWKSLEDAEYDKGILKCKQVLLLHRNHKSLYVTDAYEQLTNEALSMAARYTGAVVHYACAAVKHILKVALAASCLLEAMSI